MPSANKRPSKTEWVQKPFVTGSFHGRDARALAVKRMLGTLGIALLYFIGAVLLSFNSLWGRILPAALIVGLACYYQAVRGMAQGAADVGFGEMMYQRREAGKEITAADRERCYHPCKGLFAALLGALPFALAALCLALIAKPVAYTLGPLPSWTRGLMRQSEFGDALRYYAETSPLTLEQALRVVVRATLMPFVNVASFFGGSAVLTVERLSPLLTLIAPMGYALGYLGGPAQRAKINTGIQLGDDKKRRKELKERKQRRRSAAPERLI